MLRQHPAAYSEFLDKPHSEATCHHLAPTAPACPGDPLERVPYLF
jgi:hypothetical protein